jgi:hypothetical protein
MVMAAPAFIVGDQRAGEFVSQSDPTVDIGRVWSELLTEGLGVEVSPNSFAWNFVSMSHKAA